MSRDDYLFAKHDWFAVVQHQKGMAAQKAAKMTSADFASHSVDELATMIASELSLEPPTIFPADIDVKQREVDVEVDRTQGYYLGGGEPRRVRGTAIDVRLPFTGDAGMFAIQPTTTNYSQPRAAVRGAFLGFTITGVGLTADQVRARIDETVKSITQYLEWQSQSVGNYPAEIKQVAFDALTQRKSKIDADNALANNLGFKTRND